MLANYLLPIANFLFLTPQKSPISFQILLIDFEILWVEFEVLLIAAPVDTQSFKSYS